MKYEIKIKFYNNIEYKDRNNFLHKVFSTLFHQINSQKPSKRNYSFLIQPFKTYLKDKEYIIYFNSNDSSINEKIQNDLISFSYLKIISISTKEDNISDFIKIHNLNFQIKDIVLKNWNIETNIKGTQFYYDYAFGNKLLKELIELQAYSNLNENIKKRITDLNKSKNGKEYYSFIDNIIIDKNQEDILVKSNHIKAYNVILNIKEDKTSKLIARELVHSGIGCKNSYGFGHTEYYNLSKGKIC